MVRAWHVFRRELAVVSCVQSLSCSARRASLPYSDTALRANWAETRGYTAPAVQQPPPADTFSSCPSHANLCDAAHVEPNAALVHTSAANLQELKRSAHLKASRPLQQQSQTKKHKSLGSCSIDRQLSHSPRRAEISAPVDMVQGSSIRSVAPTSVLPREGLPQVTEQRHTASHLSSSECQAAPDVIVTTTEANETFQTGTKKKRPRRKLVQTVLPAAPGSSKFLSNNLKQQSSGVPSDRKDGAGPEVDPEEVVRPKTKTGKGRNKVCQFSCCSRQVQNVCSAGKVHVWWQYPPVCTALSACSMWTLAIHCCYLQPLKAHDKIAFIMSCSSCGNCAWCRKRRRQW